MTQVEPSPWSTALLGLRWPRQLGPALILRPVHVADAPAIAAIRGVPEVAYYLGHGPEGVDAAQSRVEGWLARHRADIASPTLALVVELDADLVAEGGLELRGAPAIAPYRHEWRHADANLWYAVRPDVQGRGVATALATELMRVAFDEVGLRKVTTTIYTEHEASRRVAARAGLRCEGTRRAHYLAPDGRWLDDDIWGILGEEWLSTSAGPSPEQR